MAELQALAGALGFDEPRTLLSTGNLVVGSTRRSVDAIEARLEAGFAERFGRHVDIIVRDAAALRRMVAGNPFPEVPAARVAVRVQRAALADEIEANLAGSLSVGDCIKVVGGDLWMAFAGPPNQSRLLAALTRKRLGVGTSRGLGTLTRIDRLLASDRPD